MVRFKHVSVSALILLSALALSGCSGTSGLSTSSLFGGDDAAKAAVPVKETNTPSNRAYRLGAVSARAAKCGYNFDPLKLKTTFLQQEAQAGLTVDQLGKLDKIYSVAFNGVKKAITSNASYCTDKKTAVIRTSLNKYLAGDFSAKSASKVVATKKVEAGAFDWFDTSDEKAGPKFGSQDWWESQQSKTPN